MHASIYLISYLFLAITGAAPTPNIRLDESAYGSTDFNIVLPNNETIKVNLSVQFLKHVAESGATIATTTTKTTTTINISSDSDNSLKADSVPQFVSVEEAIQTFKNDLIAKEVAIGGIIQSAQVFYRHFRLEYGEGEDIKIRCSYDSNFQEKTLKIDCQENIVTSAKRLTSSGELETYIAFNTDYQCSADTILDLRKIKQTYHMEIS
ncbi:uncharacterized protein LOC129614904 [Condylostylus longicornis]|uniref:uncharacterized protein LOC129614904 n=1 Tax=Condylostylus longicornis TaxID=2530218 RepID=UPI00244DA9C8|nr:uncharacterized protein LOC129614904 [Condylostylus longicornis]